MSNNVTEKTPRSAYKELTVAEADPVVQIHADYGFVGQTRNTLLDTGTATVVDNMFTVTTGIGPDGLAGILSKRNLRFKAGQGVICRLTALFEGSAADGFEAAGLISSENFYAFIQFFGTFGVARVFDGTNDARQLDFTTAATGSENASIEVDGIVYTVPLTAGTLAHNAYEAAESLNAQVPNFLFGSNGDFLISQSVISNSRAAFSFSSATAVAAWTIITVGSSPGFDFIPQSSWNKDTRLTGTTQEILDITKLNTYSIQYNGGINFFVEDSESGDQVLVHRIEYPNQNTQPAVNNSTFNVGWLVQNSASSTISRTLQGHIACGHIEGKSRRLMIPFSKNNFQAAVGTTETTVIVFRNRAHFNGKVNRIEIFPIRFSVSTDTTKSAFFQIIQNPTFTGDLIYSYINETTSVMEFATDAVGITGGVAVGSVVVTKESATTIRLNQTEDQDLLMTEGDVFAIVANVSSGAASEMTATMSWQEDI